MSGAAGWRHTLRAMHETGVLGRFLPEWARITFLVQHDFFHRYTVDEHTLKCLEALDELAAGKDPDNAPLARVFDEVKDARPLYLGMLLHDIGKGRGGGHVTRAWSWRAASWTACASTRSSRRRRCS